MLTAPGNKSRRIFFPGASSLCWKRARELRKKHLLLEFWTFVVVSILARWKKTLLRFVAVGNCSLACILSSDKLL